MDKTEGQRGKGGVLLEGELLLSEVLLFNLRNHTVSTLLHSVSAKKYAVYAAWVPNMDWIDPRHLQVEISDGDVDLTRLTYDTLSQQLVREEHLEPRPEELPPEYQKARAQALSLFPGIPPDVLDNALGFLIPGRGIVLQKNYIRHDRHIWFLDFQRKSMTFLVNLSDSYTHALGGGVTFGPSTIFLLSDKSKAYLILYQDGKIMGLTEMDTTMLGASLHIKHQSSNRIIFLVKTHGRYEKADNPLFVFDGKELTQVREFPELYDVDIDLQGQLIAFSSRSKSGARHIQIKELKN